ncbi:MAG: helix-turn-helix transcriptional regulator [Rubrivivax sp.]|nr:helix-turn-helix transcriptional regulator [Rubrivivax sp.]
MTPREPRPGTGQTSGPTGPPTAATGVTIRGAARTGGDAVAHEVSAATFESSLQARHWSLAPAAGAAVLSRIVHLASGQGTLWHADGQMRLRAGDIAWLPAGRAQALRVEAGSSGVWVGVADTLLASALGDRADAAVLRALAIRSWLAVDTEPLQRQDVVRSLHAMEAESRLEAGSSRPFLAAHLTLVLVLLWRLTSRERGADASSPGPQRLLQFRHLVETQFRSRWTVARYASELAISPDRLHDLCVRALGRSPLHLLHQRVLREACSLLAGTDLPVDRVAHDLGFGSSSHFGRFFHRWTGTAPGQWRRQARERAAAGRPASTANYADWP